MSYVEMMKIYNSYYYVYICVCVCVCVYIIFVYYLCV